MKFSDSLAHYFSNAGFTHCYFVAGGNIMHLINSFRQNLKCIPVVHEVAAVIAAEYHNSNFNSGKANKAQKKHSHLLRQDQGLQIQLRGLQVLG